LGAVLLASIEKNLTLIAAWCFLSNLLVFGVYLWATNRLFPFRFQIDMEILHKMLHFSGYMFLETLAVALFQHFDKVIVGVTLGPALAGVYAIGTSLALRLSMVTGQATEVMIPYASLRESLGDQQKLGIIFRQLSRYISLALAGMVSLLIIWMNEILSVWISSICLQYTMNFNRWLPMDS
jgi:O-antigen/teichoic acid export membrane protein